MRGPPRLLPIAGGGDHTWVSTPLRGVSNPTCLNKTPHAGVHRASCPSRAGGTTLSSPPHSVGCPTQHATTRPRIAGVHRASRPSRAGGTTFSSPPRQGCPTQHASTRPRIAGSTAPPAHLGRGGPNSLSTPLRGV